MPIANDNTQPDQLPTSAGIILAEGFRLRLYVRRGVLHVEDTGGPGGATRRATLPRSRARGARIVLLGRAGSISVEALRWIAEAGAGFALIDAAVGRVVASALPEGAKLPALRRVQALAGIDGSPVGLAVAKYLIETKIAGQERVLEARFPDRNPSISPVIAGFRASVRTATSIREVIEQEANAAIGYWHYFQEERLSFVKRDIPRLPAHWFAFGPRSSPTTGGPRGAATPGHALVNLLNAYAELEARIACQTLGLDPPLGIVHVDQPARDSLVFDLLETVRSDVEDHVLQLARSHTFSKSDFHETQKGILRVSEQLARGLAGTLPTWRRLIAPHVEEVARIIGESGSRPVRVATKLTEANRSAGRDGHRKQTQRARTRERVIARMLPPVCVTCGTATRGQRYCPSCLPDARTEHQKLTIGTAVEQAQVALRSARERGKDPAHKGQAGRRRGEAIRQQAERARASGVFPRGDPAAFEDIRRGLAGRSLREIAAAVGCSTDYASKIRRGLRVPRAHLWPALQELGPTD